MQFAVSQSSASLGNVVGHCPNDIAPKELGGTTMHPAATALNCPKCNGTMRAYERNGVVIDQCADCRGIFLDRGELERLVDAESAFYQTAESRSAVDSRSSVDSRRSARVPVGDDGDVHGYGHYGDGHHGDGHYGSQHGSGPYRKRKKGGFLSELFD
jgi:Zn-finger nucleic acid-binding protein